MPYVSKAQQGYFHSHKAQLEKAGVDVDEWDEATSGMHNLPEHKSMKEKTVDLGKKGSFKERPGALHEKLGIPLGEKIPASRLESHPGDSSELKHEKASAKGFRSMNR